MEVMFKRLVFTVAIVLLAVCSVFAGDIEQIEKSLRQFFPNLEISSIQESPIKGLYEVVAGGNIIYFSPDGYIIFGEIWSKDGVSITAKKREEIMAQKMKGLPLDKAIKVGNGKNVVIEVSDPDCPFCRRASEFFAKRTNVTRYIFLYPIIGPQQPTKEMYILCSKDREKAYYDVYVKAESNIQLSQGCEEKVSPVLNEHIKIAQTLGVTGVPALWINGVFVSGANLPLIENLLKGGE